MRILCIVAGQMLMDQELMLDCPCSANASNSYAITPIVVFDGSRRVSAKARELERRLNARKLLAGRAESVSSTGTCTTAQMHVRRVQDIPRTD